MDRISDSGSDDYGSTPYGDTCKSLYHAVNQHYIAIFFFSYWHITGKISDSAISGNDFSCNIANSHDIQKWINWMIKSPVISCNDYNFEVRLEENFIKRFMITLKDPELFSITSPEGREHYYDPIIFWQEYSDDIPEPKKQPTEKEAAEYMKFRHTRNESNEWDELGGWDRYEVLRRRYDWRDIITGKEGQQGLKSPDGKILLPEMFHTVAPQTMSVKYGIKPVPVFNGEGWGLVLPGDNPVMLTDFIYKDVVKDRWGDSVYLVQSKKTEKWGALLYIETYSTFKDPIKRRADNRIKVLREILPLEYDEILEDEICGPCASTTLWIFRKGDKLGILNSYSRSECLYDGYDIDVEEGIITLYQGTTPVNYTKAFKSVY